MGYVDFILNLAGLLLWLNWRSVRFDPLGKRKPATLMGTLRPASPKRLRRWHLLVFIAVLLLLRALAYYWLGGKIWAGKLDLGVTVLSFRSDWFLRMLAFSVLSFGLSLAVFYLALLALSLISGPEPIHGMVKIPLGWVDDWPKWTKVVLPPVVIIGGWLLAGALLVWLQVLPPAISFSQRLEQAAVIAAGGFLVWKFPLGAILVLYLLNSYIYFGTHPFWKYVNTTGQKLLRPVRSLPFPLRFGRADFAPLVALGLIFLTAELADRGLVWLYGRLPL